MKRRFHREFQSLQIPKGNVISRLKKHSQLVLRYQQTKKKKSYSNKFLQSLYHNDFKTTWKFLIIFLSSNILKNYRTPCPLITHEKELSVLSEKTLPRIYTDVVSTFCLTPLVQLTIKFEWFLKPFTYFISSGTNTYLNDKILPCMCSFFSLQQTSHHQHIIINRINLCVWQCVLQLLCKYGDLD